MKLMAFKRMMNKVNICIVGSCGIDRKQAGGSSYFLRNLVDAVSQSYVLKDSSFQLHLIAEYLPKTGGISPSEWSPPHVKLHRAWRLRDFVFTIPIKLCQLKPKITCLIYEPFLYGSTFFHTLGFFFMLPLIKLLNKDSKLIILLAGAHARGLPKELSRQSPLPPSITDLGLRIGYRLIVYFADAIWVTRPDIKEALIRYYGAKSNTIYFIPLGVQNLRLNVDKIKARELLSLDKDAYVILNFGYLSYYKGLEELLKCFFEELELDKNAILLIVGGLHPRLCRNRKYQRWVKMLLQYAKRNSSPSKKAIFTGFIPTDILPNYFAASDLVVLPYTAHDASSGPLHDAISYEVPLLITKPIVDDPLLNDDTLMLDFPEPHLLASKIKQILTDDRIRDKIKDIVRRIKQERLFTNVAIKVIEMFEKELLKEEFKI
jgi:glycosyltransferase involved in cell wall biosynthesis